MANASRWSKVTTLKGMSLKDQKKFSYENLKHYFRVKLYDVKPFCAGCGNKIETVFEATLDHVVPRSRGGRTRLSNVQLMHPKCNVKKGDAMPPRIPYNAFRPVKSREGMETRYERRRKQMRQLQQAPGDSRS